MLHCVSTDQSTKAYSRSAEPTIVSLIVVNYNGAECLTGCLESLIADEYPGQQLIVVDNASTDGSRAVLEQLASHHRAVEVLWSDKNLGYAGGVNLALGSARGEFVAVLNMDIKVKAGWILPLVKFLEQHPDVAAVNPLIALADGKRINAVGQDIHVTGLGFNRWLGRPVDHVGQAPFSVSGIQGGAFLIRRSLLLSMGGMDTTGFLYHEDVNLSWLLRLMGFDLYCVPESVVFHDYFLTMYPGKLHLLERNRLAMLLAYLHWPSVVLLSPALLITEFLLWGYCLLRGWEFMRAKMTSYRWVLTHRPQIKKRRRLAESIRVISDWRLLSGLHWIYPIDQFMTLGRERGASRRQPVGGLPNDAIKDLEKTD